jgi:predicted porin
MKQILPIIAASIISLPAVAQQVSVFGIIDQSVRTTKLDNASSETSMVAGSYWTPKLGFQGTEDLGGGNKVSFLLESRLDAGTGTAGVGSQFFNLESSVSFHSTAGTLTLGRTDTSDSEAIDAFAGIANFGNFSFTTGAEYAVNRDNTVRYTSPNIAGAEFQIGRSFKTTTLPELDSASLTFSKGIFGVGVGYDRTSTGDTFKALGGKVNLGFASVGAMYGQRDAATDVDVMALTAKIPLGNGFSAHGAFGTNEAQGSDKVSTATVGITKELSKRTLAHAVYQDTDKGSSAGSFYQVGLLHRF